MDLDKFIKEDFVKFREKVIDGVQARHPHIFSAINAVLSSKENKIGMQILDNGKVCGEYTINLKGLRIESVAGGELRSEIHHPMLGVIKPYLVVERTHLEKIINDQGFFSDLSATAPKYLPGLTIKFL